MESEVEKLEQMNMDLLLADPGAPEDVNVFRLQDLPDPQKDLIRRHKLWLESLPKEYPLPSSPYRIGVYIRFFNQTKYKDYLSYHKKQFEDTISLCPRWTLVDFYVDHGMYAPNMENAPEWCRLLSDCYAGKVDLIITQKVSNVSRKPESLTLIARLLAARTPPVGIYFISENLFTLASYYRHDLHDPGFIPDGLVPLPEEDAVLFPGGTDGSPADK